MAFAIFGQVAISDFCRYSFIYDLSAVASSVRTKIN